MIGEDDGGSGAVYARIFILFLRWRQVLVCYVSELGHYQILVSSKLAKSLRL